MNFTAREDYGIRAVLDIAIYEDDTPVQAHDIATRQRIPEQFLDQILTALRRAGIVRGIRGAGGGYELTRPAKGIAVGDILRALTGPIVPAISSTEDLPNRSAGAVTQFWGDVRGILEGFVDGVTIQDLADRQARINASGDYMMNI